MMCFDFARNHFFFPILISSFDSAIILPHFLHLVTSNGSYMGTKTLTLFGVKKKRRDFLV